MTSRVVAAVFAAVLLTGCRYRVMRQVAARAAFEFNCPTEAVEVSQIGPDEYGAKGCGRRLQCHDVPFAGLLCDARGQPPPPPATTDAGS